MNAAAWFLVLASLGGNQDPKPAAPAHASAPAPAGTAADAITLRDGKVVLGQVVETADRRGPVVVLVRRAWAEKNVPDLYAGWARAEAPTLRRAETQRRDRLRAWRRDRPAAAGGADDRIASYLDAEIARLDAALQPGAPPAEASRLMAVRLPRTSVRAADRKHRLTGRLLLLAWTLGLDDAETRPVDQLKQGLEDRGFAPGGDSPVSVDDFLPVPLESDAEWLTRRAATEVSNSPESRFMLAGGALMPEKMAVAAQGPNPLDAVNSAFKELLGEPGSNPLPAKFRQLAAGGRVGAEVTSMEMAPDMSSTTATTTLYVNPGGGRDWVTAATRSSTVRPGDLAPDAGAELAADPQVKAAFDLVGSLGLGEIPPELKQRSLNMGSATQRALGQARAALRDDLARLALPLDRPREAPGGARPAP